LPERTFGNSRPADEAVYQTVLDIAKKHCPVARAGDREAQAAKRGEQSQDREVDRSDDSTGGVRAVPFRAASANSGFPPSSTLIANQSSGVLSLRLDRPFRNFAIFNIGKDRLQRDGPIL
jgi:hypothetical protein